MNSSSIIIRTKYQICKNLKNAISKSISYISDKKKADSSIIDDYNSLNQYMLFLDSETYLYEKSESFTWSNNGDIDAKKDLKFNKINNNILWSLVISFKPDFAFNNGLISKADYYQLTSNVLPTFFSSFGLDLNNISWYASLHRNTNNPHLHIIFFEHNKKISNPRIPYSSIHQLKSNIANYIIANEKFYKLRDKEFNNITKTISLKEFNKVKNQRLFSDNYRKELNKMLLNYYDKLPKKGRLQYNSKNIKPYKSDLDNIIKYILMHDSIKYDYAKYVTLLDQHQKELLEIYGHKKNDSNNYFYSQLNKLYAKIGNEILSNFKIYSSMNVLERESKFLSKHITEFNFKSRNDYAKDETKKDIAKGLYKICMLSGLNHNQTKKVFNDWIRKSHYDFDVDSLMASVTTFDCEMSSTELYDNLKKLGYDFNRYKGIKDKNFYRELNYKKFINQAVNHLMYEVEQEQKEIERQLEYDLESI